MDIFLLGAGASAPLGLPTAKGFLKDFQPTNNNLFYAICEYLNVKPAEADVEAIMPILEGLSQVSKSCLRSLFANGRTRNIATFKPSDFNFGDSFTSPYTKANIEKGISVVLDDLSQQAKKLYTEIKTHSLRKLKNFKYGDAFELLKGVFQKAVSEDNPTKIFTTNYDLVIERAFCDNSLNLSRFWRGLGAKDLYLGFKTTSASINIFSLDSKTVNAPGVISIFKLHGSVNWLPYDGNVTSSGLTVPNNPDEVCIIYPGYKGVPEKEPFVTLHLEFLKSLQEADRLISIGFAFRDLYINAIIHHALSLNEKLKVYAMVPEFPNDYQKDSQNDYQNDSQFPALQSSFPNRAIHLPGKLGENDLWDLLEEGGKLKMSPAGKVIKKS